MASITTAAAGNWSATATWTGGSLPAASDTVVLNHAVTLDQDATIAGLTNANRAKLSIDAGKTLSSTGNVTLATPWQGSATVYTLLEMYKPEVIAAARAHLMPFGRDKGEPLDRLSSGSLRWLAYRYAGRGSLRSHALVVLESRRDGGGETHH